MHYVLYIKKFGSGLGTLGQPEPDPSFSGKKLPDPNPTRNVKTPTLIRIFSSRVRVGFRVVSDFATPNSDLLVDTPKMICMSIMHIPLPTN